MQISDQLFMGKIAMPGGIPLAGTGTPAYEGGVGPLGQVYTYDVVPVALGTANVAALQAQTAASPLALAAGTGVTAVAAPDGTGKTVYQFDVERCVSITSASNLSAGTFTVVGYSVLGQLMTQVVTGPNATTVTTLKAFYSVLSVTPNTTSASTASVGTSDKLGLPFALLDAGYVVKVGWNNTLLQDTGTLVVADTTNPATNATGDTAGTYLPSSATNGTKRLVFTQALTAAQVGPTSTMTGVYGVTQA
jgi:hypothetical protein